MKKSARKITVYLLTVILLAAFLTACGEEKKDVQKGKKRYSDYTPTSVVTPTETPTPDVTGTPEVTPTPNPGAELTEVMDKSGAFSLMLPEDADFLIEEGMITARTDSCYLEAYYLISGFGGMIYDIDDFREMIPSENTLIDALDVGYYEMFGELQHKMVNGVSCLISPASEAMVRDGSGVKDVYSRFLAYDCEDEFGIIIVWYTFTNTDYNGMTDADWEEDAYWQTCAQSLKQYHSPLAYNLIRETHYLDDGSKADFLIEDGSVKEIETQNGGGLSLKPYGTQNVELYIQHINKNMEYIQYDTPQDVYDVLKESFDGYMTFDEPQEDLGNLYWMMYGEDDGVDYEYICYCAYGSGSDFWLFMMQRPEGQEDAGEEKLFYTILWSFRDIYMYKY